MIGRYIDALAKAGEWAAIDRVITAQMWITISLGGHGGPRCLRGHVEGQLGEYDEGERLRNIGYSFDSPVRAHSRSTSNTMHIGLWFDMLFRRFGRDRVVRAIKQRCGRHTRVRIEPTLPTASVPEPVETV